MNFPLKLCSAWSSSCCSYNPFVDACHASTEALAIGFLVLWSMTVPCIYTTSPSSTGVWIIEDSFFSTGASCLKNGPRIALAVGESTASAAFLNVISSTSLQIGRSVIFRDARRKITTYDSKPMTSQTNCPSFLLWSLILPASLRSSTPSIHSSTVSSISRAKSWTCLMSAPITSLIRGLVLGPIASMTFCVKFGSNLCVAGAAPFLFSVVLDMFCGFKDLELMARRRERGLGIWRVRNSNWSESNLRWSWIYMYQEDTDSVFASDQGGKAWLPKKQNSIPIHITPLIFLMADYWWVKQYKRFVFFPL